MTDADLPFRLDGRRALVTGASRGIGRAVALALGEAGAAVAVHYARNQDQAKDVASAIRVRGARAEILGADLSVPAAGAALVDQARRALGGVDILVVNASIETRRDWRENEGPDFDREVQTNLRAGLDLAATAVPDMAARGWGRLIFVGSIQSRKPNPRLIVYAALKSAQLNMAGNLAIQLAPSGITVNTVSPGSIETDRNSEVLADAAYRARVLASIPQGRVGAPGDCAGAVRFLCSDAAGYITGADIPIDGGRHLT